MPKLEIVERTRVLSEDQFQRLLWMLEAIRQETRAAALIQQRTEAVVALPEFRKTADDCARAAGAFGGKE